MKTKIPHIFCLYITFFTVLQVVSAQSVAEIPSGSFHSVLPEIEDEAIKVGGFYLDKTAVTNANFVEFLKENSKWRRSEIPEIYTRAGYLKHWENDLEPGDQYPDNAPVTRISWFAANAYCNWAGGRLPSLNEWEYSAQLMEFSTPDDMNAFSTGLMGWYSAVSTDNSTTVGSTGIVNLHGVQDQFGLIMEWVEDFEPPVGTDISLDCGTVGRMQQLGSVYSYAASVRYITRMSFNAKTVTGMVGFRCAYNSLPSTKINKEVLQ